ncbi:enoyl-CoA hydratase/isomerase family protein [Mycolicibacterium sp. P1-18]|uniref:enoyl-CoA hydratase/isomerase family protein n=1 Tax=Mycolicibacterium sp. P1-18 TaxID=2024615 RepID=UPI0011F09C06|nr:enoyl-CoA hydratase-related protein [Mycolicibacterium sp. P1-18]KAA0098183.1 enoyl-CoA hydratase/isomerase family protein [Mycolicibacterium sp. P1-18]
MPHLELSRPRPDVAVITLNRPDKLNALNFGLVEELHQTLDEIGDDDLCRVVVLTGAGRGFCSGLDLTDPFPDGARRGLPFPRSSMRWQERIAELTVKLSGLRQPVISAVNGPAYGGGFALAMASDIRIASSTARFCTQFIKLGLGGCDIGVSYTLPRIVGAGQAFDLVLTARTVEADEALRIGLVSRLATGPVLAEALAIAETLCDYGKFGLESTKQVLWANPEAPSLQAALHLENRSQVLSTTTGELTDATSDFASRKKN